MSEESLLKRFPKLNDSAWAIYSARRGRCNCAGFAIGFESNEMWPADDDYSTAFWPEHLPTDLNMTNFQRAYESFGFAVCDDGDFEDQVVKIAIYQYSNGEPSHVAWQHSSQRHWHSKIGADEDIIHELDALSGPKRAYGVPVLFMQVTLERYRELWREFRHSRAPRDGLKIAECEIELGLN